MLSQGLGKAPARYTKALFTFLAELRRSKGRDNTIADLISFNELHGQELLPVFFSIVNWLSVVANAVGGREVGVLMMHTEGGVAIVIVEAIQVKCAERTTARTGAYGRTRALRPWARIGSRFGCTRCPQPTSATTCFFLCTCAFSLCFAGVLRSIACLLTSRSLRNVRVRLGR